MRKIGYFKVTFKFVDGSTLDRVLKANSPYDIATEITVSKDWYELGESDVYQVVNLRNVKGFDIQQYVEEDNIQSEPVKNDVAESMTKDW